MRTNIELDDDLIAEAMKITGLSTKKATVEKALRDLARIHRQMHALHALEGMGWEGDLDEMRTDWDTIIVATYCIENGYERLHDDRDFQPMADHLGLRLA
ncbi:hypothetical protein DXT91_02150 [Agrobacterium tumefaciens]|nr:hypothetical protein [Agrobacterium tumefaciens]